jgi:hypothetical protein
MPERLRSTLNLLLVPAVVAGLWTLASLRNQRATTYIGTWREDDGWHTGDPYAPPPQTNRPIGFTDDDDGDAADEPRPRRTPVSVPVHVANAFDVDDDLDGR